MGFHIMIKILPFCKKSRNRLMVLINFFLTPFNRFTKLSVWKKNFKNTIVKNVFFTLMIIGRASLRFCKSRTMHIFILLFFFFSYQFIVWKSMPLKVMKRKYRRRSSTYVIQKQIRPFRLLRISRPFVLDLPSISVPRRSSLVSIMVTFFFAHHFFRLHIFSTCRALLRSRALA